MGLLGFEPKPSVLETAILPGYTITPTPPCGFEPQSMTYETIILTRLNYARIVGGVGRI